ncbi:uncharacterized protein CcaverHIS019_0105200 [Cutaneotrichosporon cavernicola]|uniref:DNA topoisomerase (ATP-hydrolyzing) n=1 Tax=Cutaneotrichosporon cavernicola TaxID=279322 RepID=A0AA48L0N8_9TREE|nr:uncharacterized protein CcaverHIS019_0105200 [Cutaneotrichosporon cavernicola]BEI87802.1 hypothetical protein CcaverHIS019_0105200 [Cutaneotrichosporon cavernicola]BEI95576.1 hypothetical protein CcaverHIS631_0105250 [Cutaneotrichosporon cavernicola]
MLSFSRYPTSSLKSTAAQPSSSSLPPLLLPVSRHLLIDDCTSNEPLGHSEDDDDEFLLGFSSSSQGSEKEDVLATSTSFLHNETQLRDDSLEEARLESVGSLSKSPCQANQPTLLSLDPAIGATGVDDAALFEFLKKRRQAKRDVELSPIQSVSAVHEPLPPDKPASTDPLDLYFKAMDDVSVMAADGPRTLRGSTGGDSRILREHTFPHEPRPASKQPVLLYMTRVLLVASVLYDAILNNSRVTLRDVYYRDVSLFKQQRVVNSVSRVRLSVDSEIVDDLIATVGLKRDDLHVCAASKGLIASKAVTIKLTTGEELSLSSTLPTLIPRAEAIQNLEAPDGLEWILVVEKDAVMQTLCSSRLLDDVRVGPGALGKGFPDLSTLQLLRRLADQFPCARIGALVDADPHGIGIFVARHGDLLELSVRDAQLAKKMCTDLADVNPVWRRELVHMLHLNRKAEIQVLCGPSSGDIWAEAGAGCLSLYRTSNRLIEYIVSKLSQPK